MRKIIFLILFLLTPSLFAQLIDENFDYGITETDLVTASSNVWVNHSGGSGVLDVQYLTNGLSYSGYVSSGIGGAVSLNNSRTGDNNRTFTSQSSGSLYLSALINVNSATTTASGEFIIHFGSTSTHYCRLYIRNESSNLRFGISKSTEGATFSSNNYSFSTTYLAILKYTFNGFSQDDRVDLWIFSSGVPNSEGEAGTPIVENITASTTDASSINSVSLRQGSVAHSALVDGIRIATSWSQAPLPVELTSFTANVSKNKVHLNWTTATEINNYGFEILRSDCKNAWQKIGFVNGFGNCNSEKNYSFIDQPLGGKEFKYKLRQIDFDGTYDFSSEIIVMLDEINKFQLEQNYPNPFNPFTTISYQLPVSGQVTLTVYDLLGRKVEELVNDFQESGFYAINFNGINLPSGTYFYKLECGTFSETKKFILMK